MLALGKDAHHINEELVLSILTVRTHIRRIYEKFDVHSQQELIDKVLSEEESER
jgi:DNA-binding NarL/FixJ family response regulator